MECKQPLRPVHHIRNFPPELLGKIMHRLEYFDLLRASSVCKTWRAVTYEDPEIAQLLYKRACRSIPENSDLRALSDDQDLGDPVLIHPVLDVIRLHDRT
ncbi:hypothetical protein B0H11DRAFT_2048059 [Mycena galericulata]|nr:hypothetical protein B0H11DRAFT_2048059 [Mycena galericulata]